MYLPKDAAETPQLGPVSCDPFNPFAQAGWNNTLARICFFDAVTRPQKSLALLCDLGQVPAPLGALTPQGVASTVGLQSLVEALGATLIQAISSEGSSHMAIYGIV